MADQRTVCFDSFTVDVADERLRQGEQILDLRPKAFAVLRCLLSHAGRLVTKDELLEAVWPSVTVSEASLTECVRDLRRVLADDRKNPRYIETVHGRGYRFIAVVETAKSNLTSQELSRDQVPGSASASSLPEKPSIIVLPFDNLSGDPCQEYFSDGLTEVLTGGLSKISSLFVISRNSAFTYKGKAVKVQDVGHEMGVRYVLEGSVQKADQQVRITAQLIETTTGYHLWSEQYDRPLKEIFALQDEIVQKIVTTLKLQLTLQEQGYVMRKHTDNLEAYDAVLRGQEYHFRLTKEANAQARQLYEKAIALDPQYAEAYALLGFTYWIEWSLRWSADPQTLERIFEMAQKAIALDDSLPMAHSILSIFYAQKHQYDQAIAEGERAVALDPNYADSYAVQAEVLTFAGRPEEALQSVEQAMRLNPRCPPWYLFWLGTAYQMTGRYEEAIAPLQRSLTRYPNILPGHLMLAAVYSELGKEAEAHAEAIEVLRLNPKFSLEVHKQRVPIKDPAVLERHIAALRKAGLK